MHDDAPGSQTEGATMSRLKCSAAAVYCDDVRKDNDTSVQSQLHRDMESRNEGGSERSSEGLDSHEADKACRRLIDSFIPGCRGQNGIYYIEWIVA